VNKPVSPKALPPFIDRGTEVNGLTNLLTVNRFWPIPIEHPHANHPRNIRILSCCFREGHLWVEVRFDDLSEDIAQPSHFNAGVIFAVDLDSMQSEPIILDPQSFQLSSARREYPWRTDRSFEVYHGWLYVTSLNSMRRYSLKSKTWEELPAAIQGHARISLVDDRIFLSTDNSILEISPDGKEARLLASSRRQPPLTRLDSVDGYACAPILKGPNASLIAFVHGKFYARERGLEDWRELQSPADLAQAICYVFDGGLVLADRPSYRDSRLFGMASGSSSMDLLLVQRPLHPMPGLSAMNATLRNSAATPTPRWQLPDKVRGMDYPYCLDRDTLWVFASSFDFERGADKCARLREEQGRHGDLYELRPGKAAPTPTPVRLTLPPGFISGELAGYFTGFGPGTQKPALFQAIPGGLILTLDRLSGLWFIKLHENATP
jgi:hypothetical protein